MSYRLTLLSLPLAIALALTGCTLSADSQGATGLVANNPVLFEMSQDVQVLQSAGSVAVWYDREQETSGPLYSAVMSEAGQFLPLFDYPGVDADIVTEVDGSTKEIRGTGQSAISHGTVWIEVFDANGFPGWTTEAYLTEYVNEQSFCGDTEAQDLMGALSRALTGDAGSVLGLVSPVHGLHIQADIDGETLRFDDVLVTEMMEGETSHVWAEGLEGTFSTVIAPKLGEALASGNVYCNAVPDSVDAQETSLPNGYTNFNQVTFQSDAGETWTVTVEYVEENPYIVSLHRL